MTQRGRDYHHRLEPRPGPKPLERGFAAELADPLWLLGRQWQLGEHRGENAASPIALELLRSETAIALTGGDRSLRPADTPQTTPPEAVVEGEVDEWWTPGRRIRVGRAAVGALPTPASVRAAAAKRPAQRTAAESALVRDFAPLLVRGLPSPYEPLDGTTYDGRLLYERRTRAPLRNRLPAALFADVTRRPSHWQPVQLTYEDDFRAGNAALRVRRHDGGDVDWWTVDASTALRARRPAAANAVRTRPSRFRYPGAPHPRWWQIEDAAVDIGGYPPDRTHFPTLLLIDLLTTHADDWFTFALDAQLGQVVTLHRLTVVDAFGDRHAVELAPDGPEVPDGPAPDAAWSLFAVDGLGEWSLPLWPTAATPLAGEPLEQVVLGVDEDANLLWAVEERADGRALAPADTGEPPEAPADAYLYQPSSHVPAHWHPYALEVAGGRRRFVQARLADLSEGAGPDALRPLPRGRVLSEPLAGERTHRLEPTAIPAGGLRVERRAMLARRTDGSPVLWVQRRRVPALSPPSNALRFDVAVPPGRRG
jgi:hypothetical protein